MKGFISYVAAVSSVIGVAWAQDPQAQSDTPAPSATTSAANLIPSNISSTCSDFLNVLNAATDITTCLNDLVEATSAFSPTSGSQPDQALLSAALKQICTSGCDATQIRIHLADFYTACSAELMDVSAHKDLITLYDVMYILTPLRDATCTKDPDTNKYCVEQITVVEGTTDTGTGAKAVAVEAEVGKLFATPEQVETGKEAFVYPETDKPFFEGITKRQENNTNAQDDAQSPLAVLPDTAAYRSSGLVYLFVSPDLPANQLCTKCTQEVLASYVEFEAATPYAMGLAQSPILGDQAKLWSSVVEKCGQSYVDVVMEKAKIQTTSTDGDINRLSAGSRVSVSMGVVAFIAAAIGFVGF